MINNTFLVFHTWFENQEIMYLNVYIYETVYCPVQRTLVHVYVHIKKLSLRAAVVANWSLTECYYGCQIG